MSETSNIRIPQPGEIWWPKIEHDGSPWPPITQRSSLDKYITLRIIDVKDGWVRFDNAGNDKRALVDIFIQIYERKEDIHEVSERLSPINVIEPSLSATDIDRIANSFSSHTLKVACFLSFTVGLIAGGMICFNVGL